ncbi:MAG TPA: glycosyltransferase [bacterium]|nr:glycosyltransferase [bacterium]
MKVALVHDWLTGMRGGERCLEAFCELFPEAHLYTLLHNKGAVSRRIETMPIHTSFIQKMPFATKGYRYYLPLFPTAIEMFDLREYDLILSSSHCAAKGVRCHPHQVHISYCYTPMRYAWDMAHLYFSREVFSPLSRRLIPPFLNGLRMWDALSSRRVDHFIAISRHIARRIAKHYRRDARVIYPPVDVTRFAHEKAEDYYLLVSSFAPYKRIDLVLQAFRELRLPLRIVGEGQEFRRLKKYAGPNVRFLGRLSDEAVAEQMARCRAFVFAAEEDFGIAPLEAQAAGKPVIAYGKGGVLETLGAYPMTGDGDRDREALAAGEYGGLFFPRQDIASLVDAVRLFETISDRFDPAKLSARVASFAPERFKKEIKETVDNIMTAGSGGGNR